MAILKGWKTRLYSWAGGAVGLLLLVDPEILSTAFGLGPQGTALLFVAYTVGVYLMRQITTTPPGQSS